MALTASRWHVLVAFITLTVTASGQSAVRWSSYKIADGLAEPGFNAVTLTSQGRLIAASLSGAEAAELDGYSVSNFPAPPGNAGRIGESPGGQRWAMVSEGLLEFKDEAWVLHPVPEIAAAYLSGFPRKGVLPSFLPVRQGCVLFLLPQGLMEFSEENPDRPRTLQIHAAAQTQIGLFTGMTVSPDGTLWISGVYGLLRVNGPVRNLSPVSAVQAYRPPAELAVDELGQPEATDAGGVTVLADSAAGKQVVTFDGRNWATLPVGSRNVIRAWNGPDGAIWAATAESLLEWPAGRTNWVESEDISPGQINDVAVEPAGAFWLATADGLFRCAASLWSKPAALGDLNGPVSGLMPAGQGRLECIADGRVQVVEGESRRSFALPPAVRESHAAAFPLKDGTLVTSVEGTAWRFKPENGSSGMLPLRDDVRHAVPIGMLPDGNVCIYSAGGNAYLDEYDGSQIRPLPAPADLRQDAGISTLYTARNGDWWLGGQNVRWYHDGRWQRFLSTDETAPENATAFAELPDGRIWCATPDKLWQFDGQNWLLVQTWFNHITALLGSRSGEIWLASNGSLFRFCQGVWLEYGAGDGLPNGAVNALCESPGGQVWAATSHGVFAFHPEADSDPPRTYARWLAGGDRRLYEGTTLDVLFDGRDKWKYSGREGLLFSYQLDHEGWSPFRDATALSLPNVAAGRHSLQVRAIDRAGNVDATPAALEFAVVTPWFREARLWGVLVLGLVAAVFFAAVAWQRHRQLIRSYAEVERKVAERTRELEVATQELMHNQKMNALGTLAAGIAHDFNNILSIIKGSAQIIEDNPDRPEKIRTRVERIKTVVQQGAEIVDAMLGFSRGSDATTTRCDINLVVGDTLRLLGDRFIRETEVRFERGDGLPELSVSREFIQQILINFIFNAAEAMEGRKRITLATEAVDRLPPDIFLQPSAAPSFVLISVRDCGAGIAPEIKARIFEPFFTTKALSARRGTGLGLSMVYELAKKMGAGLAVQSVVGEGSVFTLILPVRPEPADKTPERATAKVLL